MEHVNHSALELGSIYAPVEHLATRPNTLTGKCKCTDINSTENTDILEMWGLEACPGRLSQRNVYGLKLVVHDLPLEYP